MTGRIQVVCPSSGRADVVSTKITGMLLYVAENEADAYREHNPDTPIVTHPNLPSMAAIRQSIYDRWGSVFMVDDDLRRALRTYRVDTRSELYMDPDETAELIQATGENARAAGCALWGFSITHRSSHYAPHVPIDLTAFVNGCAMGLHPSPYLYFSQRTTAAESDWINLLNAATHRKCWVDMRFSFTARPDTTFVAPGGQTAHRTMDTERADSLFLRRMFGSAVRLKRTSEKVTHPYQRSIRNPL